MKTKPKPQIGQFAFWTYAGFPNLLGGTITFVDSFGDVETEEYGRGMMFTPVFCESAENGRRRMRFLRAFQSEYRQAQEALAGYKVMIKTHVNPETVYEIRDGGSILTKSKF